MTDLIPRTLFAFPSMRNLVRDFFDDPFFKSHQELQAFVDEGNLAVDISESKDGEVIVRSSLPGFDKEGVQVAVHNGVLSIKAETKEEHETKGEKFYRKERRWGAVSRSVALPGNVDENNVKAELKDGVLTVRLQQQKGAQPRRIEVK